MKPRVIPQQQSTAPDRDPIERIDGELTQLAADLRLCRARGQHAMATRLADLIDRRLDERRDAGTDVGSIYFN